MFEITIHRFLKIDFLSQICIENTPHQHYISYYLKDRADRCEVEISKIDKKCVILEILRSDFEKSVISVIGVHRPTCWNWNIGYLKKCLKSRIIDFKKIDFLA